MSKRILMIAFHFPPVRGSTGLHRTLAFSRYLLEDHGWQPTVLTVHPRAYRATEDAMLGDIAPGVEVVRAFGCDTSRHLSIRGRYPLRMALPDEWVTWWLGAVPAGRKLIRRQRPDVIWSTFPIATAHLIGHTLHRRSKIPWVADFRDSMTEDDYPQPRRKWKVHRRLEGRTVEACARAVFTTPGALRMYRERYPGVAPERLAVIPNGYDERIFLDVESPPRATARERGCLLLVHSGLLYPSERDPRPFLAAVAALRDAGHVSAKNLRIVLRASGYEEYHRKEIRERGIEDIVGLEDASPYREALAEMVSADGLLLFQASNCNHQIPAKIYEYLRARRPILALTDPEGDTAGVLRRASCGTVVRLDVQDEIAAGMLGFLKKVREGRGALASDAEIESHSRRARTTELARMLDEIS
ncbi:MAG: glycosyltransferase [Planctomycetota bacterium]|jgi:glycosyltransferase involved in cell wall biosynthesis